MSPAKSAEAERTHWVVDHRVLLATLGWLVTATLAGLGWGVGVSRDIAVMQSRMDIMAADQKRQDEEVQSHIRLLREEVREMRADIRIVRDALASHRRP